METTFKPFEIKCLKTTAKTTSVLNDKKKKLEQEIESLQNKLQEINASIEQWEYPVKKRFGYYTAELVDKVVTTTDKVDQNDNPKKVTSFVLKYPDTIIPPKEENKEEGIDDMLEAAAKEELELRDNFEDYLAQQEVDKQKEEFVVDNH